MDYEAQASNRSFYCFQHTQIPLVPRDYGPFPSLQGLSRKVYSSFVKGCLANDEKLTRQCPQLLWVMVDFRVA